MTISAANRRGFSLLEMLCVIVLLALLTGILTALVSETIEVERLQAEGFDKILQNNALADQFRADVAQAASAPEEWQQYKSNSQTLILEMKNKAHVVYAWHDGNLVRHAFENGKAFERILPVGGSRVGVEFVRAGPNPKLLRLRLDAMRDGSPVPGQSLEIAAALGGDWR
jgi:prepilin-type N-terminal cleavage/methylation domain-containing protein